MSLPTKLLPNEMNQVSTYYSYQPIQPNQLRLLKFTHDDGGPSAALQAFSLDELIPEYCTLSYTWATDKATGQQTWTIEVEGQQLPVLDSLQSFVQALRSKGALLNGQYWWIDSICINLDNPEERAQQVGNMGRIYEQAFQTVVWLGKESSDSALAMDFVAHLDHVFHLNLALEEVRTMLQTQKYTPRWNALAKLLARKWWSRFWTIQEFVVASSVSLWCGTQSVDRVAMCHSLSIADKCTAAGIKETLGFQYAFSRRRAWDLYKAAGGGRGRKQQLMREAEEAESADSNFTRSLLSLTAYFCFMDVTDDRDRLYGLMALATDSYLITVVDYSLAPEEVYLRFAQSFIAHHKSLDVICFASIYSDPPGSSLSSLQQPLWVPHWRNREAFHVTPLMVSQSCNSHVGNLREPQYFEHDAEVRYTADGKGKNGDADKDRREAIYAFVGSGLVVRGFTIDEVDGLAGSYNSGAEFVQSSFWGAGKCATTMKASSDMNILKSVCKSLVLDRKDRYLRYAMPHEFFGDFIQLCARLLVPETITSSSSISISTPIELQKWFSQTNSLKIQGRTIEAIFNNSCGPIIDSLGPNIHRNPNQDEFYHDSFFGRFFDTVVRLSLRLMVTRGGSVGMVSERARKGDLICVLFGCSVPVLLRRVDGGKKRDGEEGFVFVSECFLDGWMDGKELDGRDLTERTFYIW